MIPGLSVRSVPSFKTTVCCSFVTAGLSLTAATERCIRVLIRVDLPTLGTPVINARTCFVAPRASAMFRLSSPMRWRVS
jgi:hypothetical protein